MGSLNLCEMIAFLCFACTLCRYWLSLQLQGYYNVYETTTKKKKKEVHLGVLLKVVSNILKHLLSRIFFFF